METSEIFFLNFSEKDYDLNEFHVFDINTKKFKTLSSDILPELSNHSACVYHDKIYVYGGRSKGKNCLDLYEYDILLSEWKKMNLASSPSAGIGARMVQTNNHLYILGGSDGLKQYDEMYKVDLLSPKKFEKVNILFPKFYKDCSLTVIDDDTLLMTGGRFKNASTNETFLFHIEERDWEQLDVEGDPMDREDHIGVIYNNQFYMHGGLSGSIILSELNTFKIKSQERSLFNLRNNNYLSDVTVNLGNVKFKAHKVILSQSKLFQELLKDGSNEIRLDDMSPSLFYRILAYFYGKKLAIEGQDLLDLVYAGKALKFEKFEVHCVEQLTDLTPEGVLDLLESTETYLRKVYKERFHSNDYLKKYCLDYYIDNLEKFNETKEIYDKIQKLNPDLFIELISNSKSETEEIKNAKDEDPFDLLIQYLRDSKTENKYTDVTLISKEGKSFPIHRIVFHYSQPFISFIEGKTKVVLEEDNETISHALDLVYGNDVNIDDKNLEEKISKFGKKFSLNFEDDIGGVNCKYQSDFDENGIFYYIATRGKKKPWSNPMEAGLLKVEGWQNDSIGTGQLHTFFGRDNADLWLSCSKSAAYVIDLGEQRKAKVNYYTYKHFAQSCCYPRLWNFEGSNDKTTWDVLTKHDEPNNESFQNSNDTKSFPVPKCSKFYRYFRVLNVGQNSSNHNFGIGAFEIYGKLKGKI